MTINYTALRYGAAQYNLSQYIHPQLHTYAKTCFVLATSRLKVCAAKDQRYRCVHAPRAARAPPQSESVRGRSSLAAFTLSVCLPVAPLALPDDNDASRHTLICSADDCILRKYPDSRSQRPAVPDPSVVDVLATMALACSPAIGAHNAALVTRSRPNSAVMDGIIA